MAMTSVDLQFLLRGYLAFISSTIFLWLMLTAVVALMVRRSNRYILARSGRFAALLALLVVASVPYGLSHSEEWQTWRAQNPRLERETVLGELVLPAGTQAHIERIEPIPSTPGLPIPWGMDSLDKASFAPDPLIIKGMSVHSLKLSDTRAQLHTSSGQTVDGWRCEPGIVEFHVPTGAKFKPSQWTLDRCVLAAGTRLGGIVWPGPVTLIAGAQWWVARDEERSVDVLGLRLHSLSMRGTRPYGQPQAWSGVLDRPGEFGPMRYPAGTQLMHRAGELAFYLPNDLQARDTRSGQVVAGGHTVVQAADGQVLKVIEDLEDLEDANPTPDPPEGP